MSAGLPSLRGCLDEVRERIAGAARRSGRRPEDVVLVGVTKTQSADRVREAVSAGLMDLGENRIQEAEAKVSAIGRDVARWHLIGPLQRNKAGKAIELFDRIHTVDRSEVARTLSRLAVTAGRSIPVLVQVNVSGEATKHGVEPGRLTALLEEVAGLPGLGLDGLMTIGAPVARAEDARPEFARTRGLRDAVERSLGIALPHLSMGMSGDFEVAVEEGSTFVRVGTALFGRRE